MSMFPIFPPVCGGDRYGHPPTSGLPGGFSGWQEGLQAQLAELQEYLAQIEKQIQLCERNRTVIEGDKQELHGEEAASEYEAAVQSLLARYQELLEMRSQVQHEIEAMRASIQQAAASMLPGTMPGAPILSPRPWSPPMNGPSGGPPLLPGPNPRLDELFEIDRQRRHSGSFGATKDGIR